MSVREQSGTEIAAGGQLIPIRSNNVRRNHPLMLTSSQARTLSAITTMGGGQRPWSCHLAPVKLPRHAPGPVEKRGLEKMFVTRRVLIGILGGGTIPLDCDDGGRTVHNLLRGSR